MYTRMRDCMYPCMVVCIYACIVHVHIPTIQGIVITLQAYGPRLLIEERVPPLVTAKVIAHQRIGRISVLVELAVLLFLHLSVWKSVRLNG